jgi:D-alanyl-lipoteichoic acid acyltransferase DltB (MBOAT superfamily)
MEHFFSYQSYQYFFDLLCSGLLLLPCYYALPWPLARRALLTLAGLYLLYFIAPRLALFYLLFWSVVYIFHRYVIRATGNNSTGLALALAAVALPLVIWKRLGADFAYPFALFTNAALEHLSPALWQADLCAAILGPLGLSFATFRAIDLLVKTSLGKIIDLSFIEVLFYGLFPPVQLVGPIIEYEEVAGVGTRPDPRDFLDGLLRIALGCFKAFGLGTLLAGNARIFAANVHFGAGELWLRLIGFSWYFYLNFAGYSDIAIGAARLFGFTLKENFDFPFFKRDIQGFWNAWHASLSRWAQRNVFVPCGGYRAETQYTALFLTMLAIALWHNLNAAMAVFAVVQFGALALHRHRVAAGLPAQSNLQTAGATLLTYFTILICFPLLMLDLKPALGFYAALLGTGP